MADRTMNTLLHILEAYTELYRVDHNPEVKHRLMDIIECFIHKVYNPALPRQEVFFDADWSLFPETYKQSSVGNYINPNGHGVSNAFDTTIMSSLIKNKQFRKRLIEIHAEHLNSTFSTKRLLKIFDGMIAEIEEEMNKNSSSYGLLNELDQEKTKLEEELLEKYERQEYLEGIARKIEEYNNNRS